MRIKLESTLIDLDGGMTKGIFLKIPVKVRTILTDAIRKGEGICATCGGSVEYKPGSFYWLSQSSFEVKTLSISIICYECAGPIREAVQSSFGRRVRSGQDGGADGGVRSTEAKASGRA